MNRLEDDIRLLQYIYHSEKDDKKKKAIEYRIQSRLKEIEGEECGIY